MTETDNCIECGCDWVFLPGDLYCPMCGKKIPFLKLEFPDQPYLFADKPDTATFKLEVTNVSKSKLDIRSINSDPPCIESKIDSGITIKQGETKEFTLKYTRRKLRNDVKYPVECEVKAITSMSDRTHEDTLTLIIRETPTVETDQKLVPVSDSQGDQVQRPLKITINKAAQDLGICSLSKDSAHTWYEIDCNNLQDGSVKLSIYPQHMEPGVYTTGIIKVGVSKYGDLTTGFVAVRSPIKFTNKTGWVVLTGQDRWFGITYKNLTQSKLTIEKVSIDLLERNGQEVELEPSYVELKSSFKDVKIGGHQESTKGLNLRLRADGRYLEPGNYNLKMKFELGAGMDGLMSEPFSFSVREPDSFHDFVGIDFGTCNSCAAKDGKVLFADSSTMDLMDSGEILTGQDAKYFDDYVSSIKLDMGTDKELLNGMRARNLAYEYLKKMLWLSEEELERRIDRVVFTHPSRFTNRQLNDLRYAIGKLKEEGHINDWYMIDEASAAAINVVASMVNIASPDSMDEDFVKDLAIEANNDELHSIKELAQRGAFSLFIFDFGGGTIDMTFSEVKFPETGSKTIKLLNVGGVRQFGGQHVNEILLQMASEQLKDDIVKKHGILKDSIWVPISRADLDENPYKFDDGDILELANKINTMVEDIELTKLEVLDKQVDESRTLKLYGYWGTNDAQKVAEARQYHFSYEDFKARITEKLGYAIDIMKQIIKETPSGTEGFENPNIIVLAGGSSRISFVKEILRESFKDSLVVSARPLKECVALGAAYYGDQKSMPNEPVVEVEGLGGKTRSSFGYVAMEGRLRVFMPFVEKGHDLPVVEERVPQLKGIVKPGVKFLLVENFGFGKYLKKIQHDIEEIDEFLIRKEDIANFSPEELLESEVSITVNEDESIVLKLHCNGKEVELTTKEMRTYQIACSK